jgi:integrase
MGRGLKLPPYCDHYLDRHGKPRHYFRRDKRSPRIVLPGMPWSPEFMAAHADALKGHVALPPVIGAERSPSGTLNAAIVAYYGSSHFTEGLGATTQKNRRYALGAFRCEKGESNSIARGERQLAQLDRAHLGKIVGKLKAGKQHALIKALKPFFDFCVGQMLMKDNPAIGLTLAKKPKTGGHYSWTERDIERFSRRHPVGTTAHLAMAIMLYTGLRISDARLFGPEHIYDGMVRIKPKKTSRTTGNVVEFRVHPDLQRVLRATKVVGVKTYIVSERRQPFAEGGLSNKMRDWCDEAGLPECSAHGLRKAIVRRMLEAGATEYQVAAVTGHADLDEIRVYARGISNARLGTAAIDLLKPAGVI